MLIPYWSAGCSSQDQTVLVCFHPCFPCSDSAVADIDNESGKPGGKAAADESNKKKSEKPVDVKEVLRVDSILAGIMRKVIQGILLSCTFVPLS